MINFIPNVSKNKLGTQPDLMEHKKGNSARNLRLMFGLLDTEKARITRRPNTITVPREQNHVSLIVSDLQLTKSTSNQMEKVSIQE